MKKIAFMAAMAALTLAGCQKDDGGKNPDGGDGTYQEYSDHIVYHGESYAIVTLADGNTWMADNLRYVPEGIAVSEDPAVDAGIWYPYTYDGTDFTVLTSEEDVAQYGLLYDAATLFGEALTADNAASFEGKQGICPPGWHIPTFHEVFNLVGMCSKLSVAAAGYEAGETPTDENAYYYNADYNGGNIAEMNAAGFGFVFSGTRNQTGSWIKSLSGYEACPMTYLWSSTMYQVQTEEDGSLSRLQYLSLGSTVTKSYPDGRLTVMFNNYGNGCPVRCVKDK